MQTAVAGPLSRRRRRGTGFEQAQDTFGVGGNPEKCSNIDETFRITIFPLPLEVSIRGSDDAVLAAMERIEQIFAEAAARGPPDGGDGNMISTHVVAQGGCSWSKHNMLVFSSIQRANICFDRDSP